jgi:ectoine hydroxylase-related dioxygenase (phytanoyl-CoA dioxygenase family)
MIKYPGDGEIEVHQDFSHVDEKLYTAFNLWCPLQDTDPANGGFFLIRKSNKLINSYRSATIPHNLTHYNELFKKMMEPIAVKAGQGLLFDHRLFHYSSPNTSNRARVAVQMVVIPAAATPVFYQYDPVRDPYKLNIYELTEEFLLTKNMWQGTDGLKKIGTTDYEKIPDAGDILRKMGVPVKRPNFLKRILGYV